MASPQNDADTEEDSVSSNDDERYFRDRYHLLKLFPEELWDYIFKKVEDPKTLESLSNASPFFRELLAPQRVKFLLPTVLEIIGGRTIDVDKNPRSWLIESDMCLLKVRSVCKNWNKTIDNLIETRPCHFFVQEDYNRPRTNHHFRSYFRKQFLEGTDDDLKFHRYFNSTHGNADRNPFLGRSIEIHFWNEGEVEFVQNFIPAVRNILQKYGHHIFYCTFDTMAAWDFRSDGQYYTLLREFLQLMPSLKVLKFIRQPDAITSEDELSELREQINSNPLPTLHNLQMLATQDLPFAVFQELIRVNSTITTLDISRQFTSQPQEYDLSTVALPRLATLAMCSCFEADILKLHDPGVNWPVTKLILNNFNNFGRLGLGNAVPSWSWKSIFNAVNNFAITLTDLELELPPVEGDQDQICVANGHLSLNLPHLRNLQLSMHNIACLDFLLATKDSLVVFDIKIDVDRTNKIRALQLLRQVETGHGKTIKFLSCRKSAHESNMWILFPNMTQISFILQAEIPLTDYSRDIYPRKILGWSCNREEWRIAEEKRQNADCGCTMF